VGVEKRLEELKTYRVERDTHAPEMSGEELLLYDILYGMYRAQREMLEHLEEAI
jgi:hypothetical protein